MRTGEKETLAPTKKGGKIKKQHCKKVRRPVCHRTKTCANKWLLARREQGGNDLFIGQKGAEHDSCAKQKKKKKRKKSQKSEDREAGGFTSG